MQTPEIKLLNDFRKYHEQRKAIANIVMSSERQSITTVERFLKEAIDKCDFATCVPETALEKIVADDSLKEMLELKHGTTLGGTDARQESLQELYHVNVSNYPASEMPKFGFLLGPNTKKDIAMDPDLFYHYGAFMLVLKKENLLSRTTLTVGSSVNFSESKFKTPTFVNDPSFICVKGMPSDPRLAQNGFFNGVRFLADLITNRGLSPETPNLIASASEDMVGFENFELQFFGKISLSQDVKAVYYFHLSGTEDDTAEHLAPKLSNMGIVCQPLIPSL